jgi:uncharacterized protein YhjY with autotransporter beta-barrel domain
MNSGDIKSKVGRCAFISKFSVAVLVLGLMPQQVLATTQDARFLKYIENTCNATVAPPSWDLVSLNNLCGAIATAGESGAPATANDVSSNLGTINAGSGAASRKKKGMRVSLEEQQEKKDKGASADGGGWGLLVTPQYSNSNRLGTDLENGYESKLTGLVVGLDYRFSDSFVLGLALGQTKDKANFIGNAGFLNTSNNTATIYGTWLFSESVAIDGYLGNGNLKLDNQRQVAIGSKIFGTMSGNTTGRQIMAGLSASYQKDVGRFSLAPSLNLDYIKTSINGYNESGSNYNTNLLALHYGDRSVTSLTSSLGGRLSTSYGYGWGALIPSARLAAVHEFQNRTRQISNELLITPGASYLVETDAPDRDYLIVGLGVSAALNSGSQLFLDYEKRTQDKLLSSWSVSIGALMEF